MVTTVCSQRMSVVEWDEVLPAAVEAFSVWTDSSELVWAQEAWSHVAAAGLSEYSSDLGRGRVAVRFLSLTSLYRDWCYIAHEECLEDDPADWVSWFEVDTLEIGQLLGDAHELGAIQEYDRREEALTVLSNRARPEVARALLTGYGSIAQLFVALWRTTQPRPDTSQTEKLATEETTRTGPNGAGAQVMLGAGTEDEDDDEDEEDDEGAWESDDEILNTVTGAKAQVWEWIGAGCPPFR